MRTIGLAELARLLLFMCRLASGAQDWLILDGLGLRRDRPYQLITFFQSLLIPENGHANVQVHDILGMAVQTSLIGKPQLLHIRNHNIADDRITIELYNYRTIEP